MPKKVFLFLVCFAQFQLFAQSKVPFSKSPNFLRGQIIMRVGDNVSFSKETQTFSSNTINEVLGTFKIDTVSRLFKGNSVVSPEKGQGFNSYLGQQVEYPDLSQVYLVQFEGKSEGQEQSCIRALENKAGEHIKYAELDYLFKAKTTQPADPDYNKQWGMGSLNVDSVWSIMKDSAVSDSDIVIAIIDTGVDTAHADLNGKNYINQVEKNGAPGVDDDGNGFVDDVNGWDFVNQDNDPSDDNGHGTHVAGIAVARHDSIGMAGVSPGAKYMPLKGLQSSGGSASSVLAQAVVYAANNGADVINMSFGGYGRSFAMENALSYAYAYSFLVGAAGNDALCIRNDGYLCPDGSPPSPLYPGAYSYVLGVQSTQEFNGYGGFRSWFSNYDFDGPTFTDYGDYFNYEVYAPGSGIFSALPGNKYASWNGTSMASPAIAGAVGLYLSFHPNATYEKVFIDFINSWYDLKGTLTKEQGWKNNFQPVDVVKAIFPDPESVFWFSSVNINDSTYGDADAKLDAGERLSMSVNLKNVGSPADSVYAGIRLAQYEDPTVVDFIDSVSFLGSISPYAVKNNRLDEFELRIDSSVVNGRNINFNIYSWTPNGDTMSQDFVLTAQSGCEYNGIYNGTTVWTPDCGIIVTGNSIFDTLIIEPGTEIQIDPAVGIAYNKIVAKGKPDSLIRFTKNKNSYGTWMEIKNVGQSHTVFEYCVFEYGGRTGSTIGDEIIGPGNAVSFDNCIVRYCRSWYGAGWNILQLRDSSSITNSVFVNNVGELAIVGIEDNNWSGSFSRNLVHDNRYDQVYGEQPFLTVRTQNDLDRIEDNSFFRHNYMANGTNRSVGYVLGVRDGNGGGHAFSSYTGNFLDSNYFGFSDKSSIGANVFDFQESSTFPSVDAASNALTQPKDDVHGHVWKVIIDDTLYINIKNDGLHKSIDLGTHKMSIYFNRPMDVGVDPLVAFGVREPWTQNIVGDSATWSQDSLKWEAYFTVDQSLKSDGINRVSVRNARDEEGFPMPIEDYRFEFMLNISTALSSGFNAIGDTSSIELDWQSPQGIENKIGYNIYRYDSTSATDDTVRLNTRMVLDTNYTDFAVQGGKWYQYFFTTINSDFTESALSKGAWGTPLSERPTIKRQNWDFLVGQAIELEASVKPNLLSTEVRFKYGSDKSNLRNYTSWEDIGDDPVAQLHKRQLNLNDSGRVYYFQAQARNQKGLVEGDLDSLLTKSSPAIGGQVPINICAEDTLLVNAFVSSPDSTLSVQWRVNNMVVDSSQILEYVVGNSDSLNVSLITNGLFSYTTVLNYSVDIRPTDTARLNLSGVQMLCPGDNLSVTPRGQYSRIQWNTGDSTGTLNVFTPGLYYAEVSQAGGCSLSTDTLEIVRASVPNSQITGASGSICEQSMDTLKAPSGAASYQWIRDGQAISGAGDSIFVTGIPGQYKVEVQSSQGCQSLSAPVNVSVDSLPPAVISHQGPLSFCQGDSVTLTAPPQAHSYQWSNGDTTQSITVRNAGVYQVTIGNNSGCTAQSNFKTINTYPLPSLQVNASGSTNLCAGESVTLTASGGFASYSWSDGSSGQSTIVNQTDTISLTAVTADGCTVTAPATTVQVNPAPTASITAPQGTGYCAGDSVLLEAPAGNYSYQWSNGDTTRSIYASQAGNYSVTVSNAQGCQASSNRINIQSLTAPAVSIQSGSGSVLCQGGDSLILSATAGYANYQWSTGDTTRSIVVRQAGLYSVSAGNNQGCSGNAQYQVNPQSGGLVSLSSTGSPQFCEGNQITLSAPSGLQNYRWNTGSTYRNITVDTSGVYFATAVDAGGCPVYTDTIMVTVFPKPVTPVISKQQDTLLSSAMTGNQWYRNGQVITGATARRYRPINTGNFHVVATDTNGCRSLVSNTIYYSTIGLRERNTAGVKIYPNPTSDKLHISSPGRNFRQVVLYDLRGRRILSKAFNNTRGTLDLKNLPPSSYLLEIRFKDGVINRRLVRE
ncbi:MAG: S8 family serine peptidase [Schleiferiaceae bacterium]|nr:S8 family serine peptidase [Schleiferiaceae bacterium]